MDYHQRLHWLALTRSVTNAICSVYQLSYNMPFRENCTTLNYLQPSCCFAMYIWETSLQNTDVYLLLFQGCISAALLLNKVLETSRLCRQMQLSEMSIEQRLLYWLRQWHSDIMAYKMHSLLWLSILYAIRPQNI